MYPKKTCYFLFFGLISISAAWAESDVVPSAATLPHGSGIFSGDIFTSLFSIVLFVLLLIVLGRWAWGPILAGLQKREDHIRQSIEAAEKARQEGEHSLEEYRAQLARAQSDAEEIIKKGRQDALQLAEDMRQKTEEEARRVRKQTEEKIARAQNEALQQIYEQTVALSTDLAGRIIQKNLNRDDHQQLLQESLKQLQDNFSS